MVRQRRFGFAFLVALVIIAITLPVMPIAAQGCVDGQTMPGTVFVCRGGRWTIGSQLPLVQKTEASTPQYNRPVPPPTPTPTRSAWPAPVAKPTPIRSTKIEGIGWVNWFRNVVPEQQLVVVGPILGTATTIALIEPTPVGEVVVVAGTGVFLVYSTINTFSRQYSVQAVQGEAGLRTYIASKILQTTAITWTLAPTLQGNLWFSLNHKESPNVKAGLLATCPSGQIVRKGDGRSSGSIEIWAGVNPSMLQATVGGVHIVGSYVNYFALQTPVRIGPFPGFDRLGQSAYYYSRSAVKWACAWSMSRTVGHEAHGDGELLTVGQGLAKWQETRVKYGLTIPLVVLYLP